MMENKKENDKIYKPPLRGLRKFLSAGLAATTLASGQEARPHPKIEKDNPQRQHLASKEIKDAYKKYDAQREWVAGVVNSQAYKDKAIKNEALTEEDLHKRQLASLKDNIYLSDKLNPLREGVAAERLEDGRIVIKFGDMTKEEKEHEKEKKYQNLPLAVHEIEHDITINNLSPKARSLYEDALQTNNSDELFSLYVSSPEELDARKRVFEYELEKMGVWKYGELFTEKHLQRALELDKMGKLTSDSHEFLKFLKHEKIPKIMNTIAGNRKINSNKDTEIKA